MNAVETIAAMPMIAIQDARDLTNRIKATTEELWRLVTEAYERRAWEALGYDTFAAYAKAEFGKSSSHAYRLVDHGRVVREIEKAAGSPVGESVSERVARDIKPVLVEVTNEIKKAVASGQDPQKAVEETLRAARDKAFNYGESRRQRDRSNRIVSKMASAAASFAYTDATDLVDDRELDVECVSAWIDQLRDGASSINDLIRRLERIRSASLKTVGAA